jgi:hypothetical protein
MGVDWESIGASSLLRHSQLAEAVVQMQLAQDPRAIFFPSAPGNDRQEEKEDVALEQ